MEVLTFIYFLIFDRKTILGPYKEPYITDCKIIYTDTAPKRADIDHLAGQYFL